MVALSMYNVVSALSCPASVPKIGARGWTRARVRGNRTVYGHTGVCEKNTPLEKKTRGTFYFEEGYRSFCPQGGWCIEAFVSILVQSQSKQILPGGGGVLDSLLP